MINTHIIYSNQHHNLLISRISQIGNKIAPCWTTFDNVKNKDPVFPHMYTIRTVEYDTKNITFVLK